MASEVNATSLSATIRFQRRRAVSPSFALDVSLEAPAGITIVFGPSGAGKSTLLDCIAGLLAPEAGRIAVGDDVLFDHSALINRPPQKRRGAYLFQSPALFPHLTVAENVRYGIADLDEKVQTQRIGFILEAFHVAPLHARKPSELSGGEKQRVALARSLVTGPRFLLLDEPLTGLEAGLKSSIVEDLRAWNDVCRIPILYVTHNRDEVDALGERAIVMEQGRIVSQGIPHEVLDAPRRKRLAQSAGFENLLAGVVTDLRESEGVMRIRLADSSCEIEVPLGYASPGDQVRVAIRAGDILLAAERPQKLSARNVIEGKIVALEQRGATVVCRVDAGAVFIVHVTIGAQRALELAVGNRVWLILKTHSCHLVER
jgi:molybdate transport system ATP-binding protein